MTLTRLTLASAIALAFGLSACSDGDTAAPEAKTSETQNASNPNAGNAANPLLKASTLPFQTPDFAAIKVEHFLPAIEEGMKQQLAEIRAIADNPEPPTVANTLDAMERSGELLKRANSVFNSLTSTDSTEQLRKIDAELSPKLAAHDDAIRLDPKLFARIKRLYDARASAGYDAETTRLLEVTHQRFVLAGAQLPDADKERVRKLNEQIASLSTAFGQALLKQTSDAAVIVDDVKQLDGMDQADIASAASAAKANGHDSV